MTTRFELQCDSHGRVAFRLLDDEATALLEGLPCTGKIEAQTDIMRVRNALREPDHLVPHESDAGEYFIVIKDDDGNVLAKSLRVSTSSELDTLADRICDLGKSAMIIDQTRRQQAES